ncbi:glycosyltransferase [Shewanella sp. 10N.286.48.A6]|uniref:glycosyltransferase n=1 Tax=Shewanella sp. 10N.286.48.A6 TaxID=1880833 RepID=UPI000C846CF6|nr:glycosyltransferase [Shewanella sp. 10N.286.48.A6]PMI02840.1 hypothetical protein BCU55_04470 [Shewanella sp. 10N.286.48.A6]
MSEISVSVVCLTYNHAEYVSKMLRSIIEQDTNFKYEIIIHDDASTDGTAELIKDFEKEYPELIQTILLDNNIFQQGLTLTPYFNALLKCRGKYIAFCEGDDYWSLSTKLQEQHDFLEKNKTISAHIFDASAENEFGDSVYSSKLSIAGVPPGFMDRDRLEQKFCMLPLTTMYRKPEQIEFKRYYNKCITGDKLIQLLVSQSGGAFIDSKVVAIYRVHSGGIWSQQNASYKFYESMHSLLVQAQMLEDIKEKSTSYEFKVFLTIISAFKYLTFKGFLRVLLNYLKGKFK